MQELTVGALGSSGRIKGSGHTISSDISIIIKKKHDFTVFKSNSILLGMIFTFIHWVTCSK